MDLGIFMRRRFSLATWVLLPAVLVVTVYMGAESFSDNTRQKLAQGHAFLSLIPKLNESMQKAGELLGDLSETKDSEVGRFETLSTSVEEYARDARYTINTLSFEEPDAQADEDSLVAVTLVLSGEGSLDSILRFCNTLREKERFLTFTYAKLRAVTYEPELVCSSEFKLKYHEVRL